MILLITCLVHGLTIPLDHDGSLHKRSEAAVPFYYPVSDAKVPNPLPPNAGTLEGLDLAYAILFEEIGANESDLILDRNYTDSANVEHYFFTRSIQKTAVSNQNAAVHLQGETVLYITSSFNLKSNSQNFVGETISTLTSVSQEDAVLFAESKLNVPRLDNNVTLQFLQTATGSLVYAYVFQLRSSDFSEWYQVSVDSQLGQIVQVVNFVQRATYRVLLRPKNDPTEGFNTVINPWNTLASPLGWHNDGRTTYTVTTGNNIDVVIDKTYRPSGGAALSFTTAWRSSEQPTSATNRAASSIQLFYLLNTLHDILYQYGFTEAAGNFQTSNFNKGGRGNDRVIINHQSKSGVNNANFATPPDGQSGVMNMYLWTLSSPQKDGSMDATIPIHEYGHGVSNRLTGGPSNSACLQSKEAGGMGEGWSDALAVYLAMKTTDTSTKNIGVGYYASGISKGIRRYPYSTSLTVNPLKYSQLQIDSASHRVGEVWAEMLYEVYWSLVLKLGFSSNWYNSKQIRGNIVALQIMLAGMSLQPCNPTFIQARNAILQAEKNYYKGAYACLIWRAFAKRGLGVDAKQSGFVNGFAVPSACNTQFFADLNEEL